jgi:hypothetical protein
MTRETQKWCVGVQMENGQFARTSRETFDDQDKAETYAKGRQWEKPFMHFVARPA